MKFNEGWDIGCDYGGSVGRDIVGLENCVKNFRREPKRAKISGSRENSGDERISVKRLEIISAESSFCCNCSVENLYHLLLRPLTVTDPETYQHGGLLSQSSRRCSYSERL